MFDSHVHSRPCLFPRLEADLEVAEGYERAGYAGIVLKNHFESTVGRAVLLEEVTRLRAYGGIVLNGAVGGFNPSAVAATLALGGRVVWMPTIDARAHRQAGLRLPADPLFGDHAGKDIYACPPHDWSTEMSVRAIVKAIADADAVLATGHLSAQEVGWLVGVAKDAGVRRIVINHPTFTVPGIALSNLLTLVQMGAYAEITAYQLLHQKGMTPEFLAHVINEVGYRKCLLSSDAGQTNSPPGPEALSVLIEALIAAGLDRNAVAAMASEIPETLVASD